MTSLSNYAIAGKKKSTAYTGLTEPFYADYFLQNFYLNSASSTTAEL